MTSENLFEKLLAQDMRNERRIFWSEVAIIGVIALLVIAYLAAL